MNTDNTKTTEKSFRTVEEHERTKRAADVVAKVQAKVGAARAALTAADAACVAEATDKALASAREARRVVDDAEHDLVLAQKYAARVESEIAAAERGAIRAEIAHLEADLTVVVDDEALEAAVDLVIRSVDLRRRVEARAAQHRAEIEVLNGMKRRIGVTSDDVPSASSLIERAVLRLAEVGLCSQAQLGARANSGWLGHFWPQWREGSSGGGRAKEFLTGLEEFSVLGATGDGTPITSGTKRTDLVDEAKDLIERVKARRRATETSKGAAAKVAAVAVGALSALSALTMIGG